MVYTNSQGKYLAIYLLQMHTYFNVLKIAPLEISLTYKPIILTYKQKVQAQCDGTAEWKKSKQ